MVHRRNFFGDRRQTPPSNFLSIVEGAYHDETGGTFTIGLERNGLRLRSGCANAALTRLLALVGSQQAVTASR